MASRKNLSALRKIATMETEGSNDSEDGAECDLVKAEFEATMAVLRKQYYPD
jgi:hypothetical protein